MGKRTYAISTGLFDQFRMEAFRKARLTGLEFPLRIFAASEINDPDLAMLNNLKILLDEKAVSLASIHIPFGPLYDPSAGDECERRRMAVKIGDLVKRAADAGIRADNYTLHGSTEPLRDDERAHRLAQSHKSLIEMEEAFRSAGAKSVNVENLPRTCGGHDPDEMKTIVEGTPELYGYCLDVNHGMNRAALLPEWIEALGSRIRAFHLSDYDNVDEQHWSIPHRGSIDWHAVMAAIRKLEQDVLMIFEYESLTPRRAEYNAAPVIREYEYSAFYLENIEKFRALDTEFETFTVP